VLQRYVCEVARERFDQSSGDKSRMLQCVAVCCSVLQCVAVCCSVLQFIYARWHVRHANSLEVIGQACCSVLHCVAVCYSVLQQYVCDVARERFDQSFSHVFCSVLQCIALFCSVLQCVAVCCSVLQCYMCEVARETCEQS